jgi:hypothetical protein
MQNYRMFYIRQKEDTYRKFEVKKKTELIIAYMQLKLDMEFYYGVIIFVYLILACFFAFGVSRLLESRKKTSTLAGAPHNPGQISEYKKFESFYRQRDELIFDLVKRRYDGELERWDGLDTKAGSLIGFFSIVTSLTLAAGSFNLQGVLDDQYILAGFFIGVGLLIISIAFSLICFRIRETIFIPDTNSLVSKYAMGSVSYRETLRVTCGEMSDAVIRLENVNNDKAKWIRYSWSLFVISLGYMFILFVLFTLTPQATSAVEELAKLLIERLT